MPPGESQQIRWSTWGGVDAVDLALSRDGGESWTKQSSGTLVPLFSVSFADAQHGWAVGKAGTILRTVDGGRTWAQYASPEGKHLFSVDALSPQVAWAVGDWGLVAFWDGVSWQKLRGVTRRSRGIWPDA